MSCYRTAGHSTLDPGVLDGGGWLLRRVLPVRRVRRGDGYGRPVRFIVSGRRRVRRRAVVRLLVMVVWYRTLAGRGVNAPLGRRRNRAVRRVQLMLAAHRVVHRRVAVRRRWWRWHSPGEVLKRADHVARSDRGPLSTRYPVPGCIRCLVAERVVLPETRCTTRGFGNITRARLLVVHRICSDIPRWRACERVRTTKETDFSHDHGITSWISVGTDGDGNGGDTDSCA